jgi:uncharacterized phage protein gp47/JayE
MPNTLDSTGLTTKSYTELYNELSADLQAIYGSDINLGSDTPDGQMLGIYVQAAMDNLNLITQIYNGFDPDVAVGRVLDQRVALNGIQRLAGTNTTTFVSITTTQNGVVLQGLDLYPTNPFTVSDATGNQYQLLYTQTIATAGTNTFQFQASKTGAVLVTANTITVPVTIILGVSTINNPTTTGTVVGTDEETDAALRVRRQKSVQLASQGYFSSLYAALNNLTGITAAYIYENVTGTTDADGIPSHSIWVIAAGASHADIANAIYLKRNAGCGMKGAITYPVLQADGSYFTVAWDTVSTELLYIKFDVHSIDGINAPLTALIQSKLPTLLTPNVYSTLNINEIATLVQQIDPNALVSNAGLSFTSGSGYQSILTNSAKNEQFLVLSANISITVV